MTRKTSRRFANYSKQSDEQQFNEQMPQQPQYQHAYQPLTDYDHKEQDNDSAIADMAQGFIQAQAKMNEKAGNANNLEIALLLQKCNDQLEEIRRSAQGNSHSNFANNQGDKKAIVADTGGQKNQGGGGQDNKQQVSGMPSQELQGLLASLLQGKTDTENKETQSSGMSSSTNNNKNNTSSGNQQNMIAAQNVSQVLAQAQYELANELESSLKKLKQVISESEKIANNISNLLGEEATKKS